MSIWHQTVYIKLWIWFFDYPVLGWNKIVGTRGKVSEISEGAQKSAKNGSDSTNGNLNTIIISFDTVIKHILGIVKVFQLNVLFFEYFF